MKLLVVSHACARATNQQIYVELQRQKGWKITLVTPKAWPDEFGNIVQDPPHPELAKGCTQAPTWASGSIVFHVYRKRWAAFLQQHRFDAIYVNHEPYALATAQIVWANKCSIRVPLGFYSCQNIVKCYPPPFSWMERMVYRDSRFAFPITSAVDQVLRRKGFQGETQVAPLPLDPDLYHPRSPEENLLCIPRSSRETILGYVGRIVEAKGLRTLAQALAGIKDLSWKLILIGTGEFEPELRKLLQAAGLISRVHFLGFVPHAETPTYLAAMDLLILPSETQENWKEQFGRVVPEAMACGTAVVGSNSGEIPHLIEQSGGGLVFQERDVCGLVRVLRRMIKDPEERQVRAEKGRVWAKNELSTPEVAKKMAEMIERIVGSVKR